MIFGMHLAKEEQWKNIPRSEWNLSQKVANTTRGYGTLATATTIGGALVVEKGLRELQRGNYVKSLGLVVLGFSADLADGPLAEYFGVKSPAGEKTDAVIDKLIRARSVWVYTSEGVLTKPEAAVIVGEGILNAGLAINADRQGIRIHPSRSGKLQAGAQTTALVGFHAAFVAEKENHLELASNLRDIATAALVGSIALAPLAAHNYSRQTSENK